VARPGRDRVCQDVGRLSPPAAHRADLWICSERTLTAHADHLLHVLAPAERHRAPMRALGRGMLRILLGRYLAIDPAALRISRRCPACGGDHGRPTVSGLTVSVSYASGIVAYAVAQVPIGVDVENMRAGMAWQAIARTCLPSRDAERLPRAPGHERPRWFLEAWTANEALAKALGVGLLLDGDDLTRAAARASPSWTTVRWRIGREYVGAAAVVGAGVETVGPRWLRA
jgi:4'-phosphopantetheinyl transferase